MCRLQEGAGASGQAGEAGGRTPSGHAQLAALLHALPHIPQPTTARQRGLRAEWGLQEGEGGRRDGRHGRRRRVAIDHEGLVPGEAGRWAGCPSSHVRRSLSEGSVMINCLGSF